MVGKNTEDFAEITPALLNDLAPKVPYKCGRKSDPPNKWT